MSVSLVRENLRELRENLKHKIRSLVTTQEHELKTLSDNMCDLNSLKESVKEHSEEIIIIKEDYTRMKTHLNVSAKLELQVFKKIQSLILLNIKGSLFSKHISTLLQSSKNVRNQYPLLFHFWVRENTFRD